MYSLTKEDIQAVEAILGYTFNEDSQLIEALFVASPGSSVDGHRHPEGNKRLAMIGDAVLQLGLLDDWYAKGTARAEATRGLQTISDNSNLSAVGERIGIDKYITLHHGQTIVGSKVRATTMEALLGAVFYDSGKDIETVKGVLQKLGLAVADQQATTIF